MVQMASVAQEPGLGAGYQIGGDQPANIDSGLSQPQHNHLSATDGIERPFLLRRAAVDWSQARTPQPRLAK